MQSLPAPRRDRLVEGRRRDAEDQAGSGRPLLARITPSQMDSIRPEGERRLDVIVDDELHPGLATGCQDGPASLDDVVESGVFQAELDHGSPPAAATHAVGGVLDDRVEPHASSNWRVGRAAPASARRARRRAARGRSRGLSPGRCVLARDPDGDERERRRVDERSARTATKQPVSAVDMHPEPVIVASRGSPFATASVRLRRPRCDRPVPSRTGRRRGASQPSSRSSLRLRRPRSPRRR